MTGNYLTKQYVDHFLQRDILDRLVIADAPIRFSDLKEDGVENSLFMYHANKLINYGLIEKYQNGFQLTTKGARWANYASTNLLSREALPKLLVQCIIKTKDSVLIASRTGRMKELINEYMLPGGLHHLGESANESIELFLHELFTEPTDQPKLITIAETIIIYDNAFVHHTISHVFSLGLMERYEPKNTDKFKYCWMDLSTVRKTNPKFKNSQVVPTIIEKQSRLEPYETFKL